MDAGEDMVDALRQCGQVFRDGELTVTTTRSRKLTAPQSYFSL